MKYKLNKDTMYVIGVLHGDGTLCNGTIKQKINGKEYGKYRIKLAVRDKDFAERFKQSLLSLGLNPILTHYPNKTYNKDSENIYEVILNNKSFVQFIDNYVWAVPKYRTHLIEILRGFFDSEGYINRHKSSCRVVLSQNNISHLDYIIKILDGSNIPYKKYSFHSRIKTHGIENTIIISARTLHKLFGRFTIARKEEKFREFEREVRSLADIRLSQKEIDFLKTNRSQYSYACLSKMMHRNKFTIKYYSRKLGLRRKNYERGFVEV